MKGGDVQLFVLLGIVVVLAAVGVITFKDEVSNGLKEFTASSYDEYAQKKLEDPGTSRIVMNQPKMLRYTFNKIENNHYINAPGWYRENWLKTAQESSFIVTQTEDNEKWLKKYTNDCFLDGRYCRVQTHFCYMEWEKVKSFYRLAPEKWILVPFCVHEGYIRFERHNSADRGHWCSEDDYFMSAYARGSIYRPYYKPLMNRPPFLIYAAGGNDKPIYAIGLTWEDYKQFLQAIINYDDYKYECQCKDQLREYDQNCAQMLSFIQEDINMVREKAHQQIQEAATTTLQVAQGLKERESKRGLRREISIIEDAAQVSTEKLELSHEKGLTVEQELSESGCNYELELISGI